MWHTQSCFESKLIRRTRWSKGKGTKTPLLTLRREKIGPNPLHLEVRQVHVEDENGNEQGQRR